MAAEPIEVGSITDIWSYLSSVDWEEPWLWILMGFHAWCVLFTLVSLKFNYYRPQVALFAVYSALAYSSEYLNEWLANNYRKFSSQQYFDSRGMFISLVFSLPLLVNVIAIVVYWMYDVMNVMIGLKKAKVRQMRKCSEKIAQQSEPVAENASATDAIPQVSQEPEEESKNEQQKKED